MDSRERPLPVVCGRVLCDPSLVLLLGSLSCRNKFLPPISRSFVLVIRARGDVLACGNAEQQLVCSGLHDCCLAQFAGFQEEGSTVQVVRRCRCSTIGRCGSRRLSRGCPVEETIRCEAKKLCLRQSRSRLCVSRKCLRAIRCYINVFLAGKNLFSTCSSDAVWPSLLLLSFETRTPCAVFLFVVTREGWLIVSLDATADAPKSSPVLA